MTIDMSTTRTDLALESVQAARSGAETGTIPGVRSRERTREGYAVTDIRVEDEDGAQALGKPVGRYVTVDLGPYFRREADYFDRGYFFTQFNETLIFLTSYLNSLRNLKSPLWNSLTSSMPYLIITNLSNPILI